MPTVKFTDAEIVQLVNERKALPRRWERRLLVLRITREYSQRRAHLVVAGQTGEFQIAVRQTTINVFDFSVVVMFRKRNESGWFILRRYNGRHVPTHFNKLSAMPKTPIRGFHIHKATEEGQRRGMELVWAEPTTVYNDVYSAIEFALRDSNFSKPSPDEPTSGQGNLYFENN
jgi:hypothetical protein